MAQMNGLPLPWLWFAGFVAMAAGSALAEAAGLFPHPPITPTLALIFWLGNLGSLTCIVTVILKHTTRLKEELQRQLKDQHLQEFFAGLPMPAALFDRELRVVTADERLAQQAGRPAEYLAGMEASFAMPTSSTAQGLRALRRVLDTGEPVILEKASSEGAFTHYFTRSAARTAGWRGRPSSPST